MTHNPQLENYCPRAVLVTVSRARLADSFFVILHQPNNVSDCFFQKRTSVTKCPEGRILSDVCIS
jgi:hypothetical protein